MLKIIILIACTLVGGVIGGMGMGGGTLTIPLLTIFCSLTQHEAQAINLVAFIPMAIISLVIHIKNKRVKKDGIVWILVPAAITSLGGSFAAQALDGEILKRIFGGFLLILSVIQFFAKEIEEKLDDLGKEA